MGNLTDVLPPDFADVWEGCLHHDCLPKCWHGLEDGHCERLAKALNEYNEARERADNGRNTGGRSYLRPVRS